MKPSAASATTARRSLTALQARPTPTSAATPAVVRLRRHFYCTSTPAFSVPGSGKLSSRKTYKCRSPDRSRIDVTTFTTFSRRSYHSYEHRSPLNEPFAPIERAILAAAYAHVPAEGFTAQALVRGARDAGYPDITAVNAVPDGAFGLVRWHLITAREALAGRCLEIFGKDSVREVAGSGVRWDRGEIGRRLERLAWERLLMNRKIVGRWQEALAQMSQPSHLSFSLRELALLADELLHLAGDSAVDDGAAWYAKRASLASSYAAAELFMTTDPGLSRASVMSADTDGADFHETREFLGRRLEVRRHVGGFVDGVGQWLGFSAMGAVNVARSWGVKI